MANVEVGTVLPKLVDSNPQGLPVYKRDGFKVQEISFYVGSGVVHPKDDIFLKDADSGELRIVRRSLLEVMLKEAERGIMQPEDANPKQWEEILAAARHLASSSSFETAALASMILDFDEGMRTGSRLPSSWKPAAVHLGGYY